MERFCQKCGHSIASDEARFCGQCGHALRTSRDPSGNQQSFDNVKDVQNINAIQNSDIRGSFNNYQSYDPFYRPSLDITSSPVNNWCTIKRLWQGSLASLGVISAVLTIIGKNIFQIKDSLPDWIVRDAWIYGIAGLIASIMALILAVALKTPGGLRIFGNLFIVLDRNVVRIGLRCACPYSECGGVMEPRFDGKILRWVCRKNPTMHRVDFDMTQVSRAIEKGQLNAKLESLARSRA